MSTNLPSSRRERRRTLLAVLDTVALLLAALGGVNWGLVAVLDLDAIAVALGDGTLAARLAQGAVALAAAWTLRLLPQWSRLS